MRETRISFTEAEIKLIQEAILDSQIAIRYGENASGDTEKYAALQALWVKIDGLKKG
jgi:hypothetical protein